MGINEVRGPRVLAFHLPQFHPIPENDEWWEPGFTEWTNTARARRRFPGHYQPHVPADLGFYDLRLGEARAEQADLARRYGVGGFVYWHYWFGGRRLLERPVDEIVASGEPEFPFCVGWANQTWTGAWHGAHDRILVEQTYPGPDDDRAHFEHLLTMFTDRRYITVDGRPLFYIFRPEQLPDPQAFCDRWRSMAIAAGLPGLYLVAECSDLHGKGLPYALPETMGFDAGVHVRLPFERTPMGDKLMRVGRRLKFGEIYRYADKPIERPVNSARPMFPSVYPNWDNTPRASERGLVLVGSTPDRFRVHLRDALEQVSSNPLDEQLVFVKSWNEWAEGNHLEPDQRHGHAYLQVVHDELERLR